jgi:methyl-accepting chemotaxis protein
MISQEQAQEAVEMLRNMTDLVQKYQEQITRGTEVIRLSTEALKGQQERIQKQVREIEWLYRKVSELESILNSYQAASND